MDKEKRKLKQFTEGTKQMSTAERTAVRAALGAASRLRQQVERRTMVSLVTEIGAARGRTAARAKADKRMRHTRSLVGARLPVEAVEHYRRCAQEQGVSLYRYVALALEAVSGGREALPTAEEQQQAR